MKPKVWIVYRDTEDKPDAVLDEQDGHTERLEQKGYTILGHPSFIRKNDAINWVLDLLPRAKARKK